MKHIAFFLPTLHGGGAEKVVIALTNGFMERGISVDLILINSEGEYFNQIHPEVNIVDLQQTRALKAVIPLINYLGDSKPSVLISHMSRANLAAIIAKKLSRVDTTLVLVEHNTLSATQSKLFRAKLFPFFMKLLYPQADTIIGVSQAASRDLEKSLNLKARCIQTIYNPVVDKTLALMAEQPIQHQWLETGSPPVFLAVGRLTAQKDFDTVINAFAMVRKKIPSRLMILGEGELRPHIEDLISTLDIAQDVLMPGFVQNPFAYMSKAAAFILSSRWEGLGNVLIEAMACGTPVISTNCPHGPKEILENGKYGQLVPVGDANALAKAMQNVLETPIDCERLIERANYFSVERAITQYLSVIGINEPLKQSTL